MHAMAIGHGGAGCPLVRGINLHAEDTEPTDIDNESTHSSDVTVASGGPEAEGNPDDPVYNNCNRLTGNTREKINLCQ